jgi:hypothetical protein
VLRYCQIKLHGPAAKKGHPVRSKEMTMQDCATVWTVTETPCFPNAFKVHPRGAHGSNWPNNFYATATDAWEEAIRRTAAKQLHS